MEIRIAATGDAKMIRKIYSPYVLNSAVSFEYQLSGHSGISKQEKPLKLGVTYHM